MREAKIERWLVDVMRHCFCPYHLAEKKSAQATALQAGHGTTNMIFEHYRELVKPAAAAKAFWKIEPKAKRKAKKRTPSIPAPPAP